MEPRQGCEVPPEKAKDITVTGRGGLRLGRGRLQRRIDVLDQFDTRLLEVRSRPGRSPRSVSPPHEVAHHLGYNEPGIAALGL